MYQSRCPKCCGELEEREDKLSHCTRCGYAFKDNDKPRPPRFTEKPMNIVVEGRASSVAGNAARHSTMVVPWEDGFYYLSHRDYPFARFDKLVIQGDIVSVDGEEHQLKIGEFFEITREFSAMDYSRIVWPEYDTLKIYATEA